MISMKRVLLAGITGYLGSYILVKVFTGDKFYGPIEFFLTVMAMDMLAPEYGKHTLKEYFTYLSEVNA